MLKHGCDDIRIVYLSARTEMGAEQGKEPIQHDRPVFGDIEDLLETSHIRDCVPIGSAGDVAWGRVTAARYSRRI